VPEKFNFDRMLQLANQLLGIDKLEFERHRPNIKVRTKKIRDKDIVDVRDIDEKEKVKLEYERAKLREREDVYRGFRYIFG